MMSLGAFFAFAQAAIFKLGELTERRVQEQGASSASTFMLYRYALIPAFVWSLFFVRARDIAQLMHSPVLLGYILFIAITWNMQGFLWSYLLNKMSSVTALSTLQHLIYLPLLLVVGTFLNHDAPNLYSFLAIGALVVAFAIQPTHHHENTRARFTLPLILIVGLALLKESLNALNNGATREALYTMHPAAFLGIFSVLTLGLCWVWTAFIPRKTGDLTLLKKYSWSALAIPLLWFAASIPETYGFAALPIYTVVSIGAITFAFDAFSDFSRRRIRFDLRTAVFISLAVAGMGLALYSA
jgi:hypothetical protein